MATTSPPPTSPTVIASLLAGIALGADTASENGHVMGAELFVGTLGSILGISPAVRLNQDEIAHLVAIGG